MVKTINTQKWVQELLGHTVLLSLDLALLFCITFSGDYTIYGVPLFFIFWLIIFIIRRNFRLEKTEILGQIFILLTLLPILVQINKYSFEYYCGAYYAILYVNAIVFGTYVVERLLSDYPGSKLAQWLPAILLIFLGVLTEGSSGGGSRQSIIFGPNVYYRIVGVIFLLHLVIFQKYYTITIKKYQLWSLVTSFFVTVSALIITLYILFTTGSRGATIVGIVLLLSFLHTVLSIKIKWLKIASLGMLIYLVMLFLNSSFSASFFDSRAFWFYDRGASSGSIAARAGFLENFSSFFLEDNFLLGEGNSYLYSYPHNLYLDLLYNAGVFPFLVLVVFSAMYIVLLWKEKIPGNWKILTLIVLPIYLGSLVSGTLYDNYPVVSLILLLPIWMRNQVHTSSLREKIRRLDR